MNMFKGCADWFFNL